MKMFASSTAILLSLLTVSATVGCEEKSTLDPVPMTPPPGEQALSAPATGTADAGTAAAGATDPDLAIITVTAVEIDPKLATLCGMEENEVFFKFDSAKLTPDAKERLGKIGECVTNGAAKGKDLQIVGRTDPVGTDEYNKQLGKSRAESVTSYLQEQGVKQVRTETESKGEAGAAANEGGWPEDRRVTIRLQS